MQTKFFNILFSFCLIISLGHFSYAYTPLVTVNQSFESQLTTFSVSLEGNSAVINWNSSSEVQSILIERSTNNKNFEPLFQNFKNSSQTRFVDDFSGQNIRSNQLYYRLVVQYQDGSSETTKSKSILLVGGGNIKPKVFVNGSEVSFQFFAPSEGTTSVRIFNSSTGLIKSEEYRSSAGENMHQLSLYGVRSGMYFLQLEQAGKRATAKFFIQ